MSIAALFSCLAALTFVVVPLDDRPVTAQLPQLLGSVAGVDVVEPPRAMLGRYLQAGDPDAILHWLRSDAPGGDEYVVSSDMIAYGGLVASRIPGVDRGQAFGRLDALAAVRAAHPRAPFALFGTVMRLAPTGVPDLGGAASFPFAGDVWPKLQTYANLPDPPQTQQQREYAARLRTQLGSNLDAYLATRARNRDVDLYALRLLAEGGFDRVVIGQDDAGPVGLHLRDLSALRAFAARYVAPGRASIEPGADELGMALVSAALARQARIVPHVRVVYSRAGGGGVNDPLEFAPISTTIADLIRSSGAVQSDAFPDVDLFVKVAGTSPADEKRFVDAIAADERGGPLPAVADLTFLAENDYAQQRALTDDLIAAGLAAHVASFASWNTTANTIGTALPEAIAVLAGRHLGTYDARAHATFTYMRYVDDIIFHTSVRPQINADLTRAGVEDHTYLLPQTAQLTSSQNRALLWPAALDLLAKIDAQYRDAGLTITLPWNRTFETQLDVRLSPAGTAR